MDDETCRSCGCRMPENATYAVIGNEYCWDCIDRGKEAQRRRERTIEESLLAILLALKTDAIGIVIDVIGVGGGTGRVES